MKLTTGYKKPIASSGTDALELSSNNSYLLLAGGGHKALSELVSPADLTTALSNYVTIGSNQTITGVKTFSLAINADITGNASTATNVNWSGVTNKPTSFPANGGNADYATAAGNAGTLSGHTAADFVLKTTHDVYESVIAEALNDLDSRKVDIEDMPTSLPANGGNADYATSAGNANTATSVDWDGVTNKPVIGNGRLILKNGNDIISDDFTANIGKNITIDLNDKFTNKRDFELLGSKVDKIDTSITKLNNAMPVDSPFDDPEDDNDEETAESNNEPFTDKKGIITLYFWKKVKYTDLPVYDVWVNYVTDVVEPLGSVSFCYDIVLIIGVPDSIMSSVGFTLGSYKPFFIRGANPNNNVCKFDVRGNSNINTARATVTGGYMNLQCRLKLHGGDSGTGNAIMKEAKNGNFEAYLCLRQTP